MYSLAAFGILLFTVLLCVLPFAILFWLVARLTGARARRPRESIEQQVVKAQWQYDRQWRRK